MWVLAIRGGHSLSVAKRLSVGGKLEVRAGLAPAFSRVANCGLGFFGILTNLKSKAD